MPHHFCYYRLLNLEYIMNAEEYYVKLGRKLIRDCEDNKIYASNSKQPLDKQRELDEKWNAAVTAGNKLVTYGTTWSRFESINDLTPLEKLVIKEQIQL